MKSRMLHGICKLLLVVGCGFLSVVASLVAVAVAVAVVIGGGVAGECAFVFALRLCGFGWSRPKSRSQ